MYNKDIKRSFFFKNVKTKNFNIICNIFNWFLWNNRLTGKFKTSN